MVGPRSSSKKLGACVKAWQSCYEISCKCLKIFRHCLLLHKWFSTQTFPDVQYMPGEYLVQAGYTTENFCSEQRVVTHLVCNNLPQHVEDSKSYFHSHECLWWEVAEHRWEQGLRCLKNKLGVLEGWNQGENGSDIYVYHWLQLIMPSTWRWCVKTITSHTSARPDN